MAFIWATSSHSSIPYAYSLELSSWKLSDLTWRSLEKKLRAVCVNVCTHLIDSNPGSPIIESLLLTIKLLYPGKEARCEF